MALKLAGEKDGYREKIEVLSYNPDVQDSGDLEAGTKAITATGRGLWGRQRRLQQEPHVGPAG